MGYARCPETDLMALANHWYTALLALIFGTVSGRVLWSGVIPVSLTRTRDQDRGWLEETHLEERPEGKGLTEYR